MNTSVGAWIKGESAAASASADRLQVRERQNSAIRLLRWLSISATRKTITHKSCSQDCACGSAPTRQDTYRSVSPPVSEAASMRQRRAAGRVSSRGTSQARQRNTTSVAIAGDQTDGSSGTAYS